jgi:hypothetical protein
VGSILTELLVVIAAFALLTAVPPPSLQKAGTGNVRGGTFHAWGKVRFQTNIYRRVGHYGSYGLFTDGYVRRIGLKELWMLKWHREYDTMGHWIRAGRVRREDWPQWMSNFKEY